jgi:hypothetical protein
MMHDEIRRRKCISVACARGCSPEALSSRGVSLGKMKGCQADLWCLFCEEPGKKRRKSSPLLVAMLASGFDFITNDNLPSRMQSRPCADRRDTKFPSSKGLAGLSWPGSSSARTSPERRLTQDWVTNPDSRGRRARSSCLGRFHDPYPLLQNRTHHHATH